MNFVDPSGNIPVAVAEQFLSSPIGQQMISYLSNLATQVGVSVTTYVVQNWSWIQVTAQYIGQYGAGIWDGFKAFYRDATDSVQKAIEWIEGKVANGNPNQDPNKWRNDSSKKGMNNHRVMNETKIKGYNVSMDLERGGSGAVNIHVKVNGTKYVFSENARAFLDASGRRLPKSLHGNKQIISALQKAQKLIEQGW